MNKHLLFFIAVILFSGTSVADPFVKLSIGQAVRHQDNSVSELSFYSGAWSLGLAGIGEGETFNGKQEFNNIVSITKELTIIEKYGFTVYSKIGLSRVEGSNLVGPLDYRSVFGVRKGIVSIELNHISSGSLYRTNRGIDWISFNLEL